MLALDVGELPTKTALSLALDERLDELLVLGGHWDDGQLVVQARLGLHIEQQHQLNRAGNKFYATSKMKSFCVEFVNILPFIVDCLCSFVPSSTSPNG